MVSNFYISLNHNIKIKIDLSVGLSDSVLMYAKLWIPSSNLADYPAIIIVCIKNYKYNKNLEREERGTRDRNVDSVNSFFTAQLSHLPE